MSTLYILSYLQTKMTYTPVDEQLDDFEEDLRNRLEFHLVMYINRYFWNEMDCISSEDRVKIDELIDYSSFLLLDRYEHVRSVRNIIYHARILLKSVVWAAMNVPYPADVLGHIGSVVENAFHVYNQVIYPHLRTEMIMVNHSIQIIQRKWRECYYVPHHPICKRRLVRDFEEWRKDLNALHSK